MDAELKDWLDKGAPPLPYRAPPKADPKADPPATGGVMSAIREHVPDWLKGAGEMAGEAGIGAARGIANQSLLGYAFPAVKKFGEGSPDESTAESIGRQLPMAAATMLVPELSGLGGLAKFAAQTGIGAGAGFLESQADKRSDPIKGTLTGGAASAAMQITDSVLRRMFPTLGGLAGLAASAGMAHHHPFIGMHLGHRLGHMLEKPFDWMARHPAATGAGAEYLEKQDEEGD